MAAHSQSIMRIFCLVAIALIENGFSATYQGCPGYTCGGYTRKDNFAEWQQCIDGNELYNPESFDTNSFCKYCLIQEDGTGPCYCADSSECYSWWYGFGITMIVIGVIVKNAIDDCRWSS